MPYSPLGRGCSPAAWPASTTCRTTTSGAPSPGSRATTSTATWGGGRGAEIAAAGVTPGQVALAWLPAQGDDAVPIPGTKRRTYLEENVAALDVAPTADDLARLDTLRRRRPLRPGETGPTSPPPHPELLTTVQSCTALHPAHLPIDNHPRWSSRCGRRPSRGQALR